MTKINSKFGVRRGLLVFLAAGLLTVLGQGCGSKVCTNEEVKKCDDDLNACVAKAPCNDATDPGFSACVNACQKAQCDCLTKCGSTCTKS